MGKAKGNRRPPAAKRPPLTHFLCLPLVTPTSRPQLEASLRTFKVDVCTEDHDLAAEHEEAGQQQVSTIHPKAIRPVGALHCTLGVMSLDKDQLAEAVEYLRGLNIRQILEDSNPEPTTSDKPTVNPSSRPSTLESPISPPGIDKTTQALQVELRGLVSMHDYRNTSILYSAPCDPSGRLLPFCLAMQALFKDKGFLMDDNRELKLHATIVNTIYAKSKARRGPAAGQADRSQGHGPNAQAPLKIDASDILEKYKGFVWAENVVLDRVAVCEMGAKKIWDAKGNVTDEEYTEVASIALPV